MNKFQTAVLFGAALLIVLLYFSPKVDNSQKEETTKANTDHSKEHFSEFKEQLSEEELKTISDLEVTIQNSEGFSREAIYDSLVHQWELFKNPIAAAMVSSNKAEEFKTAENLKNAAEKLFIAIRFGNEHIKHELYDKAISAFEAIVKSDPDDLESKVNLGICYVESSNEPMRGIGIIKEVLEQDPENVKALINLGYFSLKSGQYDKAIERFEKVLEIDPAYSEAYLYLGDVFETRGDKEKAIQYYQTYSSSIDNPALKTEINKYIDKLITKN